MRDGIESVAAEIASQTRCWTQPTGAQIELLSGRWRYANEIEASAASQKDDLLTAPSPRDAEQAHLEQLSLDLVQIMIDASVSLRAAVQEGRRAAELDFIRDRIPREVSWRVFADCGYQCVNCGRGEGVPLTVDHIIPISRGRLQHAAVAVGQTLAVLDFLYICDKAPIPERGFSVAESPLRPAAAVPRGRRKLPLSISHNRVGLPDSHRTICKPSARRATLASVTSDSALVPPENAERGSALS